VGSSDANLYLKLVGAGAERPLIEAPDGRTWSYRELAALAGRIGGRLKAAGVTPGERVAAQVDKSPESFALYLATLRIGAVFLPLNPAYTEAEVEHFLRDARPKVAVATPKRESALAALTGRSGSTSVWSLGAAADGSLLADLPPTEAPVAARAPDDLAAILYTSGTTGRPKGAMLTHANLATNADALAALWRFFPEDRLLHVLPTFHAHGLFVAANTVMVAGGSMVFPPRFDAEELFRLLPRATAMMGVPTIYGRLLGDPRLTREACAHVRLFVSGSAPLSSDTHRDWLERTGHAILERYGMTETIITTSNPYEGPRRAGSVGLPLPRVELRIVDPETGRPQPDGAPGMLEVRGPTVFAGYWGRTRSAEDFRPDGFFITGDIAVRDGDGYLRIVGRGKDLVISGGYNVYPREIEVEIDAVPGVVESAVVGVPHPDFGEGVTAIVVRSGDIGEAALIERLVGRLARYKVPKRVLFVDDLPRNAMGKVQKNLLRDRFRDLYVMKGSRQ
jgi:malonyl-CoA/methylmalonyl-CoA synthetase